MSVGEGHGCLATCGVQFTNPVGRSLGASRLKNPKVSVGSRWQGLGSVVSRGTGAASSAHLSRVPGPALSVTDDTAPAPASVLFAAALTRKKGSSLKQLGSVKGRCFSPAQDPPVVLLLALLAATTKVVPTSVARPAARGSFNDF